MSLPLLNAGRVNPGLSAQLDLRFALDKSLTAYRGPTPSFSRASTGTYFNSSGVLTSAAINAPRFNHTFNGTSWVSRGLLVEEQRTNLLQYSEQFNTSPWTTLNASVSSNAIASPDGNTTADKLVESATGPHGHEVYYLFTASATTYTTSVFAKAGERSSLYISLGSTINNGVYFDLSAGTVGTATGGLTGQIQNVGNGWYRCSVTGALSAGSNYIQTALSNGTTYDYTGNGTSGLYLFGAQLEVGAFPTSYIPTTSASTTRSADVCQITGSDFSGFWNGTEGTVAVEFDRMTNNNTNSLYSFFGASESTDLIYQESNTGSETCRIYVGNVLQCSLAAGTLPTINTTSKTAFGFKQNDFAASQNGAGVVTDTSGNLPICTQVKIGAVASVTYNGHIARLRYYNQRLPNATLQKLST